MRTHRPGSAHRDPQDNPKASNRGTRAIGVLMAAMLVLTSTATASAASDSPAAAGGHGTDKDVTFTAADGTELHGSLRLPAHQTRSMPAALLIAGSGPTDRDGNSATMPGDIGTLRFLADTLAANGIATLRYDKLGSGETGMGPYADDPSRVDFDVFVQHAATGLNFLADQPGIDRDRLMVTGHSEGGLIGSVLATDETGEVPPIAALGLLTPASLRYLTIIENQLTAQLNAQVEAGLLPRELADSLLASAAEITVSLREHGRLPDSVPPELAALFNPGVEKFLHTVDQHDPKELAARLPEHTSVFLACATADIQVSCTDVEHVRDGLAQRPAGHATDSTLFEVNHVLKEVGDAGSDGSEYGEPLPFSRQLKAELSWFLLTQLWFR
ncbi:alpha/beta hydrolase [Actinoalloteichus hymeniacidonis]|uniref:Alpha/beta hydrolase family protein n=1 Tax=Actinoalloteichus hymeniacidonis TaxID=340345 RepID=A0AAC9HM14_9PSEU|nr:alpha/beta hydrolase [Actinoalloteichus hymeniacidonis]AOS61355.1 Alpha/beta hydrolase family protein [Actinoalloteichus hymeniacidonis]MBB5910640.1 hypothetical protein [Actinoalloteichus hymeniacidonis]